MRWKRVDVAVIARTRSSDARGRCRVATREFRHRRRRRLGNIAAARIPHSPSRGVSPRWGPAGKVHQRTGDRSIRRRNGSRPLPRRVRSRKKWRTRGTLLARRCPHRNISSAVVAFYFGNSLPKALRRPVSLLFRYTRPAVTSFVRQAISPTSVGPRYFFIGVPFLPISTSFLVSQVSLPSKPFTQLARLGPAVCWIILTRYCYLRGAILLVQSCILFSIFILHLSRKIAT